MHEAAAEGHEKALRLLFERECDTNARTILGRESALPILGRREYTKASPLVVLLGKGEHEIISSWIHPDDDYEDEFETTLEITRSNITFVGTGNGSTTILGGFGTMLVPI